MKLLPTEITDVLVVESEVFRDQRHAERVAGHQRDRAHLAGCDADVELTASDADAALVDDASQRGCSLS